MWCRVSQCGVVLCVCVLSVQTVVTTEPPESAGGGRSYAFWLLVAVVLLVAVFNLLITLTLISVLRISVGMESIQVLDRIQIDCCVGPGDMSDDRENHSFSTPLLAAVR